jgi:hypothetical protein
METAMAMHGGGRVRGLDCSGDSSVCTRTENGSVEVIVGNVSLGDQLTAKGAIAYWRPGHKYKEEEFVNELSSEARGGDALDPAASVGIITHVRFVRTLATLATTEETQPCLMTQISVLLDMEGLELHPELPDITALKFVHELEVQVVGSPSDEAHSDFF